MRALGRILTLTGLAVSLASGCSSSGSSASGTAPTEGTSQAGGQAPSPPRETSPNAVFDLGKLLTGTFEGSTPGNSLRAIVIGTVSPSNIEQFDLPVRITGKYGDSGVGLQGVIHLENQGRSVLLQYTPHFDPVVGSTTEQLQFTPRELEATCSFDVNPRGDGYFGETIGSTTCVRAIRGAVGKWSFEVEPGAIRIRNSSTGETLRFRKTSK